MSLNGRHAGRNRRRDDFQDYLDGRLNADHRARIETYLRGKPAEAHRLERLKTQAGLVREIGARILAEPVPLRFKRLLKEIFKPH